MKSIPFVLILSIIVCMSMLADGDDTSDPVIAAMIEKMDSSRIYSAADVLQKIPTRAYGTAGNEEAASFLYGELSSIPGLSIEYTDGDFKNIVAILPGLDSSSDEIFMVGAHYDSSSSDPARAPGATDNAIGTAIVLEMATIMSQYQFNHSIAFAFWNNEEAEPRGSSAYAESAAKKSTNIPLYYNVDSSGYDPKNESTLDIMYDDQSAWAKEMIHRINRAYGINFILNYNAHSCTSDHLSFRSYGYPAIMTHSQKHGPAHTPDDTIDAINSASLNYALKNGKLAMALIAQLAEVQSSKARISVSKVADPLSGVPGTNVTFIITMTNSGETPISHLFVNDILPDGMTCVSSTPAGFSQGQNVSWSDIGPMAPGSTKRLDIVAQIDSSIFGSRNLTNHVEISGKPENGLNVTANASADVRINEAKISVSKTAEPAFGSIGSNVTFTMNVTNSGEAPLSHIFVNDLLPYGMSYVSSSPAGISQGQNVFWSDIGPMAPGSTKKLEIMAQIDSSISGNKNLTNHVEVSGKPENGLNVTANASADVRVSEAKISVSKTADPSIGSKGTIVTFTLNLTNSGAAQLNHVFVSDQLPAGMTYHSSSQGGINSSRYINWTDIGPMDAGTSKSLWLKAKVDGTALGALINLVDVRGSPEYGEDVASSATATVEAQSAYINVTNAALQADGLPGSIINYTMVITNTGSADICQVSAEDILAQGLKYEWDDHQGHLVEPNKVIWDNLGCLKSGEKIQIQMAASITGTVLGDLGNSILAKAIPTGSEEMVTSEAHAKVAALPLPFNITKISDKSIYLPGEEMNYTITICNPLEYIPLEDIVIKDVFQNPSVRIVSSYPETSIEGQWDISEVPPKSCVTIMVAAVYPVSNIPLDDTASISITNFVNATAKAGDKSLSGSDIATVTIDAEALPVNEKPDAVNDTATTEEDVPADISVLGNDKDSRGDSLDAKVDSASDPARGATTINVDGNITYTPDADFCGTDTFNYTVIDSNGGSDTAIVTVTVNCVNDAPDAVDDTYRTDEDTTLTVPAPGVLENDEENDGDGLKVTNKTNPSQGTVAINADGSLTYMPNADYNGLDSFNYTISDSQGGSDTATVTIDVVPVNDAPDAVNDSITTDEVVPVTITVLENDIDSEDDPLTVDSVSDPAQGSATVNSDGTVIYTPDVNFCGIDTFTYTAIDGNAGSDRATITVTVNCVNDAPDAVDDTYGTDEDTTLTVHTPGVLENDAESDGDRLSVTANTNPSQGTVAINADGSLTYMPNADYNGLDSFNYTISDSQGGSDTATVTIDVVPVNDIPVAVDDSATTLEETPIDILVIDNDSDPENDAMIIVDISIPAHGTAINNGDGTIAYTPHLDYCDPENPDSFTYTISDGNDGTDTAIVTVSVECVKEASEAPDAVDDKAMTDEEISVTIPVLVNDVDPEGDPISIYDFTQPVNGEVIDNGDGTITYLPYEDFCGDTDSFTYTISDGKEGFDVATVTVSVNCINVCPQAYDDEYGTAYGDELVVAVDKGILLNDEDDDGDSLTAVLVTEPSYGDLVLNPDGSFKYYWIARSPVGADTFTYKAFDGKCYSEPATITVTALKAKCAWFIRNELYIAKCGVKKEVLASEGILANDPHAVAVLNPEEIMIDPKYGTIEVKEDGSFVYDAAPDIVSGTYVQFRYTAINDDCESRYPGIAKIQVSCSCSRA